MRNFKFSNSRIKKVRRTSEINFRNILFSSIYLQTIVSICNWYKDMVDVLPFIYTKSLKSSSQFIFTAHPHFELVTFSGLNRCMWLVVGTQDRAGPLTLLSVINVFFWSVLLVS